MDIWSYQEKRYVSRRGDRWHFMFHHQQLPQVPADEQPYALYFRSDDRSEFGILRFDHAKDNPYRDLSTVTRKIMDDAAFRATLLDPATEGVWRGR
jgi:hypothetical protein